MVNIEGKPKFWSYKELESFYLNTPKKLLGERLLTILKWAKDNGALMVSRNVFPSFGIRGRHGKRIMSVWSPEKSHPSMPPGRVYIFINPRTKFGGDVVERDAFVEKLNQFPSFGFGNISSNTAGKNSLSSLEKLSTEEFNYFLKILQDYGYDKKVRESRTTNYRSRFTQPSYKSSSHCQRICCSWGDRFNLYPCFL